MVRVFGYSAEHHDVELVTALQPYGKILSVSRESVPGFPTVTTGIRRVKIEMKEPVPNFIDVIDTTIQLEYEGVTRVCRRCGARGQMKANWEAPQCERCRRSTTRPARHPAPNVARTTRSERARRESSRLWLGMKTKHQQDPSRYGHSARPREHQPPSTQRRRAQLIPPRKEAQRKTTPPKRDKPPPEPVSDYLRRASGPLCCR